MGIRLLFLLVGLLATAEPDEDKRALLDFVSNINHHRNLNWDERTSVCTGWTGVTCSHNKSRVISVRLPSMGFKGSIPTNTLGRLSALEFLSLRSNGISGPFPSDLLNLRDLTDLYLDFNTFQGPLPLDFSVWKNLSVLNLSNNGFNGSISSSISSLTHLTALDLSYNSLSGFVPDFNIASLQTLNLSNNNLTGAVPRSLRIFPSSAFSGNNMSIQYSSPHKKHSKFSKSAILGIVIGSCVVALVSVFLLLILTNRNKKDDRSTPATRDKSTKRMVSGGIQNGNGRITFFEGCNLVFDLEDLLRASAEVLGKGTYGTTYRAVLEDAAVVAVKRLKEVTVGRKEFEQQMEIVGNIRHENIAPLRAYYYSKDEKLMVYDYYNQGSVSALLHAKRSENRTPLDWEQRLKIAIGAARGIAHIHSRKLVHGNIKASNIFLNSQLYGCICDLWLAKGTQAGDVYGFGVLVLELLSGKCPGGEDGIQLVRWVESVVREEWTGEVFDLELLRFPNIEEEMVALLQIGFRCVARIAEERSKIDDVVKMLEDITESSSLTWL